MTFLTFLSCLLLLSDITLTYSASGVKVNVGRSCRDSVEVTAQGSHVNIDSRIESHQLTIRLSGQNEDGGLMLRSRARVLLQLHDLSLQSREGAVLSLKNHKKVEIQAMRGTRNSLTIVACQDTAQHHAAAIWSRDKLKFSGRGELSVLALGDGCKGIRAKDDVTIEDLTLSVETRGDNLGRDERPPFGGAQGPPFGEAQRPPFGEAQGPPFGEAPEDGFRGDHMPDFDMGDMPEDFPFPPDGEGFAPPLFPGMPGGEHEGGEPPFGGAQGQPFGMPMSGDPDETFRGGFKQRYVSPAKALKSDGTITIRSGHVSCRTASAGAEGIEGKKGVVIQGGTVTVDAIDDAINANGQIQFLGGTTVAQSHGNDAVDANMYGRSRQPGIVVSGGSVSAWSHVGAPEEGMDCDFSPIEVSGGTLFTIGAGMGDMPSVPTSETAHQPTLLLVGLDLQRDDELTLMEEGRAILRMTVPFTFRGSNTLLSSPSLKTGHTYTLKTGQTQREFLLRDNFTIVRRLTMVNEE